MTGPDARQVHSSGSGHGTAREVFTAFLLLGVTSFGGPIAHLGYFRAELVARRRWVSDAEYSDLMALSQFLPGPASSQVGFGLGLHRAGPLGALAAFVAFTLPSAVLLVAFAAGAAAFGGVVGDGILAGLTIAAVAVVAQAVLGMRRSLAPDRVRASIAVVAAVVALVATGPFGQLGAIALGAVAGVLLCRSAPDASAENDAGVIRFPVGRVAGGVCLGVFLALLAGLPVLAQATGWGTLQLFDTFYRAGALVFGGGHVVLPLLQAGVVDSGWVTAEQFVAGYGAVQAVPGPLFTFAAYLGALSTVGPGGAAGAAIALVGIFAPGLLLLVGVMPFWNTLRTRLWARALMRGTNAAVVGILAAALYDPVFVTAITGPASAALALLCLALLLVWRMPAWSVVAVGAVGGLALALLS